MALIACKECGKEISTEAVACPNCGVAPINVGASKLNDVNSLNQKLGWKEILTGLIFGIGVIAWLATHAPINEPPKQETSQLGQPSTNRPIILIDIHQLAEEYNANEVATDEKYKESTLHVAGVVQSIDKDFSDSIVVKLALSNIYMPASMQMMDTQKSAAIQLKKGVKIVVECKKIMRIMDTPTGSDCKFINR